MFVTGATWLIADWLKSTPDTEIWQTTAAWLLTVHGGGAMATLLLFGALIPVHAHRAWRAGRNRASGAVMIALGSVLVATSFGLYYTGSETLRPWISDIHIAAGFCLPAFLIVHVALGRRTASRQDRR
jgi:hypothetical protein